MKPTTIKRTIDKMNHHRDSYHALPSSATRGFYIEFAPVITDPSAQLASTPSILPVTIIGVAVLGNFKPVLRKPLI